MMCNVSIFPYCKHDITIIIMSVIIMISSEIIVKIQLCSYNTDPVYTLQTVVKGNVMKQQYQVQFLLSKVDIVVSCGVQGNQRLP